MTAHPFPVARCRPAGGVPDEDFAECGKNIATPTAIGRSGTTFLSWLEKTISGIANASNSNQRFSIWNAPNGTRQTRQIA
jgi:hypothetical protein